MLILFLNYDCIFYMYVMVLSFCCLLFNTSNGMRIKPMKWKKFIYDSSNGIMLTKSWNHRNTVSKQGFLVSGTLVHGKLHMIKTHISIFYLYNILTLVIYSGCRSLRKLGLTAWKWMTQNCLFYITSFY